MSESENENPKGVTRREALKVGALALGGLAVGRGTPAGADCPNPGPCYPDTVHNPQQYSYFFDPNYSPMPMPTINPIDPNSHQYIPPPAGEMRITFMGSCIPPVRRSQCMMSVFVEVGPTAHTDADSFVSDCGSGVCATYGAMGVGFSKMQKVFLTHLHGDHMSDLTHIYCFGPSADRKTPLYVWGPSRSGIRNPKAPPEYYEDGLNDMCKAFRKAWRWHSESFSFLKTADANYQPPKGSDWGLKVALEPLGGDSPKDGYALIPIELNWKKYGKKPGDNVAYDNPATGARITHFPVIHCRQGSIGYKLEWNGMSMIYTGDTRPETHSVAQASGVDVFIHECVVPPDVWAFKNLGLDAAPTDPNDPWYQPYQTALASVKEVQESSHTPQGAFGYLLSQIQERTKLTIATHFPVSDDTVACALKSIQEHCPWAFMHPTEGNLVFSFDLMVIKVNPAVAGGWPQQFRAVVNDYGYAPLVFPPPTQQLKTAKYHDKDGNDDPVKQLDRDTLIQAESDGNCNYRDDGY